MPTLGLRRSLCVVLWVPVRGGLACVVLGSRNAGIGLVSVVSGVPIHTELAIVVVRSPNAGCVVSGVPVHGVLVCVVLGFPTGAGPLV